MRLLRVITHVWKYISSLADLDISRVPARWSGWVVDVLTWVAPDTRRRRFPVLHRRRHRRGEATIGASCGTDLADRLRARGVDTVVMAGIATTMGVESTVRCV
ncbi:isochorismatase family protein [Plantactinospora sp. B6F1]|uniref:isochorismatase family protein n=1 Tax=Plantactinospora sp. B6F1 TaxID=3158971 RepID=UPI0032D90C1D